MAHPEEIVQCKERFAHHSDEQLIAERHQWIPNSAEHIAAVQLLHERDAASKARAEARAEESLSISRNAFSVSRKALRNSTWARWIATIAILVAIIANHSQISAFIIQWFSR